MVFFFHGSSHDVQSITSGKRLAGRKSIPYEYRELRRSKRLQQTFSFCTA